MSEPSDPGRSAESFDARELLPESADVSGSSHDAIRSQSGEPGSPDGSTELAASPEAGSSPSAMDSPPGELDSPEGATKPESGPEASAHSHPDGDEPTLDQRLLAEISATVRELAVASERYHTRAQQREAVIDHLRAEIDLLRRGERRALLRPLLAEVCRLRDDLMRQADDLPDDFSVDRARLLLRSYAESAEIALENSGVTAFIPGDGEPFDPRMHRRVGGQPTSDHALHGCIAAVRRSGYMDIESGSPIAPADVVLMVYSNDRQTTEAGSVMSEGNVTQ
jgi:molecular chaperone GrpE